MNGQNDRIEIVFAEDFDGSLLPAGVLSCDETMDSCGAFIEQTASNAATFTTAEAWNNGWTWRIAIPTLPLTYPQSGHVIVSG